MYMDAVFVVNKTYKLTPDGPEGLLKNQRRKCLMIHATDGFDLGEMETPWVSYFRTKIKFMGIEEFESIAITGADGIPEKARECIGEEIKAAAECAARF